MGMTTACTGAHQNGKAPAKCSVMMPMKRSKRAVDGAVDGDGTPRLAVLVDVGQVEALGQHHHVRLDGGHLPLAAERVVDVDVDLGRVEGAVPGLDGVLHAGSVEGVLHEASRRAPTGPGRRAPCRDAWRRRSAAPGRTRSSSRGSRPSEPFDLIGQLVGAHVAVGVVLDEVAHARQARERARALVAVQVPVLGETQREVAIGAHLAAGR